jgi:pimeloyl-ACP methyl ester carboxylesterase
MGVGDQQASPRRLTVDAVRRRMRFLRRQRERRARAWEGIVPDPDSPPVILDVESDSGTALMAFGGLNSEVGMPPFEFFSLTSGIPVKRLFVRDLRQAWYHGGLPGYGDSLLESAESLRELLSGLDVSRLVVAGGSAGGYAALAYGTLLGADEVLSFSPQTVIGLKALAAMKDHRWDDHLKPLFARGEVDPAWVDLREALPRARWAPTIYRVYVDGTLAVDRRHVDRLKGLEGLRLYRFGGGSHYLLRALRDCGALERLLRRSLTE